ncbi:MAG: YeaH/YhbH family protein [Hyphomicrobiaceae bacterium]|nr:YeaH/YhbH family protein [Hyphomicrobiaceae bacterium]
MHIIDRRRDPSGKSLANRQRFIRRSRALVKRAVEEASQKKSIKEMGQGGEVSVPAGGVHEPYFRHSAEGGVKEYVLPGNKTYVEGDEIPRPEGGDGGRGYGGDGEDEFRFVLTDEEFMDLFLEDLELPDLAKRQIMGEEKSEPKRAGFRTSGPPAAISVARTMRNSLSRRIALRRPTPEEVAELEERLAVAVASNAAPETIAAARSELERLRRRLTTIPFIDPIDVRYRRFESEPTHVAKAVIFCLMDVSGSMDEHRKDLAKRFFSLLYLFLSRRYSRVEVVFIRHTHEAKEVDEETFFHSPETGGTIVSTALDAMAGIASARYPVSEWNIYAAQASDGDNLPTDNATTLSLLRNVILPMCQYYAYVEVGSPDDPRSTRPGGSTLWRNYELLTGPDVPLAMRRVADRSDIYPVFRELFEKKSPGAGVKA